MLSSKYQGSTKKKFNLLYLVSHETIVNGIIVTLKL